MKQKIALCVLMVLLLAGCISDPGITTIYIYKNATDKEITVKSYKYKSGDLPENAIMNNTFSVLPDMEFRLSESNLGITPPVVLISKSYTDDYCYLIISDGEKQITTKRLYDSAVYERLDPKKDEVIYSYTFTDKDFDVLQPPRSMGGI